MNSLTLLFFFFKLPDVLTRFQLPEFPELHRASGEFLVHPGTFRFPTEKEENNTASLRAVSSIPEHWNLHFWKTVYQGVGLRKEMRP